MWIARQTGEKETNHMGRKKKTNDASAPEVQATEQVTDGVAIETTTSDGGAAEDVEPAADVPADSKADRASKGVTLQDLCGGYIQHLEDSGKSVGTVFSYKLKLVLAMAELGAKTKASALTPKRIAEFFESDRVMRTKSGVEKAPPTFLKTRRVLRQALVWAAETRLIPKAPLPEESPAS